MNKRNQQLVARTLTNVSLWSWIGFVAIELLRPTTVTRLFSPHIFLVGFLVGAVLLYFASKKGNKAGG